MTQPRKVLMVAPEAVPFVKVGGLADVVGALTKALDGRGHDVRIVMPRYAGLQHAEGARPLDGVLVVQLGGHEAYARVWECEVPGSKALCYFIEHNEYFDHPAVYGGGPSKNEDANGRRFAFLSRAAIDLCTFLDWVPDVLHCHDWTTGIVPVYLNTTERSQPIGRAATLMTLHNMGHQGWFHREVLEYAGLPDSVFRADGLESMGELNMLKGGIYHATKVSTVSPTYAREIQEPGGGAGLDHVLRYRSADLIGVINGIDETEWSPETDAFLSAHYSASDLSGKAICKADMQRMYGLTPAADVPVFTVVARLVEQKGLDLLAAIVDRLMMDVPIQIAVLGTGDAELEGKFAALMQRYPGRFGVHFGFNNELSHITAAGSDFLLMPSRFEPCGLSQMYSMVYGAPPIVRATGGLKDSVAQYIAGDDGGTGFLFEAATPDALYGAICRARSVYYDQPADYAKLQQNGMLSDFTWEVSAGVYEDIYGWAIAARSAAFEK